MGLPTRFHGDPQLDDPNLIKGMCSNCNQIREWKLETQADGSSLKICGTCGMKVDPKVPEIDPQLKEDIDNEETHKEEINKEDEKGGIFEKIQKVISQIGNALK